MSKARTLANLISDNSVLADGQIAVAEVTGAAPLASPTFSGNVTTTGSFIVGNASLNENDLESIDGITAGTVAASKAVVVNSNKDASGFRNISLTGTVDGRDIATDGTKLDGIAASANNYTHPNHSGEVTSSADGATVIADNIVDEANLKISNTPTNGYVLTAQSGNTGGLTWAEASSGADLYTANESSPSAQPSATGTNAIAIGDSAVSTNTNSFAGPLSRAGGTNSFAMGIGNNGTSYGTVGNAHGIAMGQYAKAQGNYDIAIGRSATASGENDSIAIGRSTTASSGYAVAIGYSNLASGNYSIAMGYDTTASAANATAIGSASNYTSKSNASGQGSVAIGGGTATATDSMALGNSRASGANSFAAAIVNNTTSYGASNNTSIAIGYNAKSTNLYATAIGYGSHGNHSSGVAIGRQAVTTANNQVALNGTNQPVKISGTYTLPTADGTNGQVMTTNGSGVVAFADAGGGADLYAAETTGSSNPTASGTLSIAIGSGTTVSGNQAVGVGRSSTVAGYRAAAFGGDNTASAEKSLALGFGASSSGARGVAINGAVTGQDSISFGTNSYVQATYATAVGYNADISGAGTYGTALGHGAQVTGSGATALTNSRAGGASSFAAAIANNTASYGASGANSVAIGATVKATASNSVAIGGDGNTASGARSGVLAGNSNIASGGRAVVIGGASNNASGDYSTARGSYGYTNSIRLCHATGLSQHSQGVYYLLGYDTTDATPIALNSNLHTPSATNQIVLQNNSAYAFSGTIVAREKASEGTDVGAWEVKGIIRREANAGTTVLVNSVINELNAPTGWAVALTANTTLGCLKVEATGVASTNIKWLATIETSEVKYA